MSVQKFTAGIFIRSVSARAPCALLAADPHTVQPGISDTKCFTPEINDLQSLSHQQDHTIIGSTTEFRPSEFQIEQVSLGAARNPGQLRRWRKQLDDRQLPFNGLVPGLAYPGSGGGRRCDGHVLMAAPEVLRLSAVKPSRGSW